MLRSCRKVLRGAIQLPVCSTSSSIGVAHKVRTSPMQSLLQSSFDQPGSTCVEFVNSANNKLRGTFVQGGNKKVVILCHGFASSSQHCHYPDICCRLQKLGYSSLRFDFSGNGRSEGKFFFGKFDREVEDLRCAVEQMRLQGQHVLGVVGHSKAGTVVLMYASKYQGDVPFVVNIAGRFDMKLGLQLKFGNDIIEEVRKNGSKRISWPGLDGNTINFDLTQNCVDEVLGVDNVKIASSIDRCGILTIHGDQDVATPIQDAYHLAKHLPKDARLLIIEGADHCFTDHGENLITAVVEFVSNANKES